MKSEASVVLLDAVKRMHRMKHDDTLINRLGNGPIPMVTAPWRPGPVKAGIYFRIEEPPIVHLWSHFETFPTREAMLNCWVVDEAALYGEAEDDGQ